MRTDMSTKTLTLQTAEDVLRRLEHQARQEHTTTEHVAAEALRKYASSLPDVPDRCIPPKKTEAPYRFQPVSLGRCYLDDLSCTSKVPAWAEGEDFR